jgi:RNA polymerase sigma factor (sigma-70 family)
METMLELDSSLIAEFNARRCEDAFAALVRQHVNLVFATAMRQVGDAGAAEEITQNVFVALAQAAGRLGSHPTIAGWLHQTALNKSREWLRSELRRRKREQVAVNLDLARAEGNSVWSSLVPLLDEALLELREPDRQAVILHFMEGRTFHEVGSALGVGEDAARKRVNRCLDQLTQFFRRHGFTTPAHAAGAPLFALSSHAAPAGLAASATTAGLAAAHSAASTSTLTLIKGALKIMAWTKAKTAIVAGVAAIVGIGTTVALVDALLPSPEIEGTWIATELLGGSGVQAGEAPKTRLVLKIVKVNGNYQVTGDDIDRGYKDVPINFFTYKHRHIHAEISDIPDTFEGTMNLAGTKISGRWKEGKGGSGSLEFAHTANPPPFPEALTDAEFAPRAGSDLQGLWQGWIGSGKGAIHFEIKIAESSDGAFRADFYCPDQKAVRQPTSVSYDGATVKLMPMAGYGMFQGELRNGREMSGEWIQGGGHTPTKLTRVK